MFLASIVRAFRAYINYRKTMLELSMLDDRSLSDIGLNRGQIPGAAWDSVRR